MNTREMKEAQKAVLEAEIREITRRLDDIYWEIEELEREKEDLEMRLGDAEDECDCLELELRGSSPDSKDPAQLDWTEQSSGS